jgi:hypothetical protein
MMKKQRKWGLKWYAHVMEMEEDIWPIYCISGPPQVIGEGNQGSCGNKAFCKP